MASCSVDVETSGVFWFIILMPQVQTILGATAKHGKTILQFAARSGNKESFEAVLAAVTEAFNTDKVKTISVPQGTVSLQP